MAEIHIGIDLGTTNSLIAAFEDGEARLLGGSNPMEPSVIAMRDGALLVGNAAKEQETVSAFKRAMGTEKRFRMGPRTLSAIDLSALVLTSLKEMAEEELPRLWPMGFRTSMKEVMFWSLILAVAHSMSL